MTTYLGLAEAPRPHPPPPSAATSTLLTRPMMTAESPGRHLMREDIRGHQRSSESPGRHLMREAIRGHQRSSEVIKRQSSMVSDI